MRDDGPVEPLLRNLVREKLARDELVLSMTVRLVRTIEIVAIARTAGVRFVGLCRPGHPDAFAGSGVPVVTSLTDLARLVACARRSPVTVTIPAAEVGPSKLEPLVALATAPFEVADLVGPHQPAHAIEDAYRRDGAVGDLDVPVDLGSRLKRSRRSRTT